MKTIISNKIYVYDCTPELYFFISDQLVITNPTWATMKRLGKEDTINRKHIPQKMKLYAELGTMDFALPFGVLNAIWPYIKNYPYELRFNDNGQVIDQNMKISMPLFDYQEEAVQKMIAAKGGILKASAGSGKTQIGIELIKRIGRPALWICGKTDLLNQTVARIHKLYPDIPVGTITDGEVKMVPNGIVVSTVQTLVNVDSSLYKNAFDVVTVDESHACVSSPTNLKMFGKVVENIAARYKFGLTATPDRSDTMIKSMYAILGCSLLGKFEPTFEIAKDKTNTLFAKHIKVDLDTPWTYDVLDESGVFDYSVLVDYLGHNQKRNQDIVDNVIKASKTHQKQLVLCSRVEQCEIINDMLQARGINSVLLVGNVSKKKRKEILTGTKSWNVISATISLCKEGLDIPELSCLHWAMVVSDKVATIQSAGRIERVFEGKPEPEIYDYVDVNYPYCIGKYKKRVLWLKRR